DLFRDSTDREADHDELVLSRAVVLDIAEAAARLRGVAQRLVKIFQVEYGAAIVRHDEIQRLARRLGARGGSFAIAMHLFGDTPGPHRDGRGGLKTLSHIAQNAAYALLFGGADVGERSAGLKDLGD